MGTGTANLSGDTIYTFNTSSGATARWSNNEIFNALYPNIPAFGSTITSAQASFKVQKSSIAIFREWSIADDDGNNNVTILNSGTSASTSHETRYVDLKSAGIVQSVAPKAAEAVKFKRGYIRYKGEVKTGSGNFRDCKIVINWDDLIRSYSVKANSGGNVEIVSTQSYNSASISGSTVTLPYFQSYASINIKATPIEGFVFDKWTDSNGNTISTDQETKMIFDGNRGSSDLIWTANFKEDKTNKIYIGTSQPKSIYVGTSEVKAVYVGTTKVYG